MKHIIYGCLDLSLINYLLKERIILNLIKRWFILGLASMDHISQYFHKYRYHHCDKTAGLIFVVSFKSHGYHHLVGKTGNASL